MARFSKFRCKSEINQSTAERSFFVAHRVYFLLSIWIKQGVEFTFILKNGKIIINWNFTKNLCTTYYSNGSPIF